MSRFHWTALYATRTDFQKHCEDLKFNHPCITPFHDYSITKPEVDRFRESWDPPMEFGCDFLACVEQYWRGKNGVTSSSISHVETTLDTTPSAAGRYRNTSNPATTPRGRIGRSFVSYPEMWRKWFLKRSATLIRVRLRVSDYSARYLIKNLLNTRTARNERHYSSSGSLTAFEYEIRLVCSWNQHLVLVIVFRSEPQRIDACIFKKFKKN